MVRKDLPDWGTVAFPGGELGESIEIFFLGRSSVLEKHFSQSVPPSDKSFALKLLICREN